MERNTKAWDTPDQEYQNFLADKPELRNLLLGDYEQVNKRYIEFKKLAAGLKIDESGVETQELDIGIGGSSLPVRIYKPRGVDAAAKLPALVVYHGGGWVIGDLQTEHPVAVKLCAAVKCVIFNVDYRLAPEHVFPCAADDAVTALDWVIAHTKDYNIDESRIGLYGSSAGANLALVTALQARERNIFICGLILRIPPSCHPSVFPTDRYPYESYSTHANAPILNREAMNNFFATYASGADVKDHRLSPLLADMKGLPSTYMEIAGCDPLRDDGLALCAKMRAANVDCVARVFNGVPHAFASIGSLSQAQEAYREVQKQVERILKG